MQEYVNIVDISELIKKVLEHSLETLKPYEHIVTLQQHEGHGQVRLKTFYQILSNTPAKYTYDNGLQVWTKLKYLFKYKNVYYMPIRDEDLYVNISNVKGDSDYNEALEKQYNDGGSTIFNNYVLYDQVMNVFGKNNVSIEDSIEYYLGEHRQTNNNSVDKVKELLEIKDDELDVSTNGVISELIDRIFNIYKKGKMEEFVKALVTLPKDVKLIFKEINRWTVPKEHYTTTQTISELGVTFKNYTSGEHNIDFLTWIIQSVPLLSFYVPRNTVKDDFSIPPSELIEYVEVGISFYSKLNEFVTKREEIININKLMFLDYHDTHFNKLFFTFDKDFDTELEPIKCNGLNVFRCGFNADGFDDSTLEDFMTIKKNPNIIWNTLYCHRYLDIRHLSTILLGCASGGLFEKYRSDIKKGLLNYIKTDIPLYVRLQLYTRIKLVYWEYTKLSKDCQNSIKEYLSNLFM